MTPHDRSLLHGIYVVLDSGVTPDLERLLAAVLAGGARVVQYRAKNGADAKLARRLSDRTTVLGGLFIVNDDLDVALGIPGAGFHAGQEDLVLLGPDRLRAALPNRVLGLSCGVAAEAVRAEALGADYLGVGPFAATGTKADAGPAIGEPGLRAVASAVSVPVAAIGGIGTEHLAPIVRAGARMAAVVSFVARDPDPEAATRRLVRSWAGLV